MSHICVTCGTQYPNPNEPPRNCPICEDERQYVGPLGQKWIALPELQKTHRNVFFEEGENLWGIHTEPNFAIGQRALLLQTQYGGILWDCLSLIDASTFDLVKALGGLSAIAISHPHYYTSMVEWSRAFGGIPIYLHEADREWVQHHDSAIVFWSGEKHSLNDDLTLIRVGGHFSGLQVLHIREPPLQSGTEIDRFVRATGTPSVLGPNTATMVSRSQRQTTGSPLFLHLPAHQNLLRLSCFRSRLPSCWDCESGNKRRVLSPDSRCGRADSWWHPGNHLRKRLLVKGR